LQLRIKNIRQHIILKKTTGVLLLCTFLLSITPKLVLHNISAHHKDQSAKKFNDKLQLNESGFNCDCNSIVATSPFTELSLGFDNLNLYHFSLYTERTATFLSSADHYYSDLRGPPAIV
jgi:hypothetical protein